MQKLVGLVVFLLIIFIAPCGVLAQIELKQETVTVLASDSQSKKKLSKKQVKEQEAARVEQERKEAEDIKLEKEFNNILLDQQRLLLTSSSICAFKELNDRWNKFLAESGDFIYRKDLSKKQATFYSLWIQNYSSALLRLIAGVVDIEYTNSDCDFNAESELKLMNIPEFIFLISPLKSNLEEIKAYKVSVEVLQQKLRDIINEQDKLIGDAIEKYKKGRLVPSKEFSAPPTRP